MNHGLKKFELRDSKTDEHIFTGVGVCAQEVYETWRREDLRPMEVPRPEELESEDAEERLEAFTKLNKGVDSWIDDPEIKMNFLGFVSNYVPLGNT